MTRYSPLFLGILTQPWNEETRPKFQSSRIYMLPDGLFKKQTAVIKPFDSVFWSFS